MKSKKHMNFPWRTCREHNLFIYLLFVVSLTVPSMIYQIVSKHEIRNLKMNPQVQLKGPYQAIMCRD